MKRNYFHPAVYRQVSTIAVVAAAATATVAVAAVATQHVRCT